MFRNHQRILEVALTVLFIWGTTLGGLPVSAQTVSDTFIDGLIGPGGLINLTSDQGGGVIDTYEDVDLITNIHEQLTNPAAAVDLFINKQYVFDLLKGPGNHSHVWKAVAEAWRDRLASPRILLTGSSDDPVSAGDVADFFKHRLFAAKLSGVTMIDTGEEFVVPFDFGLPPLAPPQVVTFQVSIDANWTTAGPISPWPNFHLTCSHECATLWLDMPCPNPPCPPNPSDPYSAFHCTAGPADPATMGCYDGGDLKALFLASVKNGKKKKGSGAGTALQIIFKDRTPPRITDLAGNQFPRFPPMGDPTLPVSGPPATTGDFYRPTTLRVFDNTHEPVATRFAIGRILGPVAGSPWSPVETWGWVGPVAMVPDGQVMDNNVFLPNECLGKMQYSVFAWDVNKVVNPGEPNIQEDSPGTCYGYRDGSGLGVDPLTAQPFPVTLPADPDTLDPSVRVNNAEGEVWVDDNDFPNLMIKVLSKKDPNHPLFFPPAPGKPMPTADPDFFPRFLENADPDMSSANMGLPTGPLPKFSVKEIDLGNSKGDESAWTWKFRTEPLTGAFDVARFVGQSFRLEDYSESDNDPNGVPYGGGSFVTGSVASEANMGGRSGFGKSAKIQFDEPLIEDVEYEVTLWAEDNVKWITPSPTDARVIPAPYTGIERGGIAVEDPGQIPPLNVGTSLKPESFTSDSLRVIFREPTPDSAPESKMPRINASVRDYKGNERSLTVLFKVKDEQTRVRILEQQHKKN